MPKFRIGGSYGYVGTDWEEIIETEDLESAQQWAWDQACERVEAWAEEIDDEEDDCDDEL